MSKAKKTIKIYHLVWAGSLFDEEPSLISENKTEEHGVNGRVINRGNRIDMEWPKDFTIYVKGTRPVDYFLCGGFYGVVSDPVRKVVQAISNQDVEFLPVRVVSSVTNQEFGQFWVLNVITKKDALNWEQTTWTTNQIPYGDPQARLMLVKPVLEFELIKDANIFLVDIQGKTVSGIYLSALLKEAMERANCTLGMKFSPIKVT